MENLPKSVQEFYCLKCDKMVTNLYQHLEHEHDMTVDEYLEWMNNRNVIVEIKK